MLDTFPKTTVDVFALVLESGGCNFLTLLFKTYVSNFSSLFKNLYNNCRWSSCSNLMCQSCFSWCRDYDVWFGCCSFCGMYAHQCYFLIDCVRFLTLVFFFFKKKKSLAWGRILWLTLFQKRKIIKMVVLWLHVYPHVMR